MRTITRPLQRTTQLNSAAVEAEWFHIDATDRVVGRLAASIATVLMGKHKPTYTPHVDTGDFVVVTNVEKVHFSGKKWEQKKYAWYTGYTRQRTEVAGKRLEEKPDQILREAVRRMLPKNKLANAMLTKLKLYAGPEHPHQAQQPTELDPTTIR
ncbi:50S ribosomal protein L13 [Botrimarina colliarenosi]|uniref:Large ribosomal subunit protein uL13 n=1 Tax=Botrimarina colliarenosi TaxID=2528001 RepID=A0A5C6AKQ7_9BACT|nr:50S ribosomal protein L13 [Botrimarina colliarenosi]TWU00603.1 50S ribosomal protein L13 [Botrimarina colliarenosi]